MNKNPRSALGLPVRQKQDVSIIHKLPQAGNCRTIIRQRKLYAMVLISHIAKRLLGWVHWHGNNAFFMYVDVLIIKMV
jgi:hypothetical protein